MLKAIHAQESRKAAAEKMTVFIAELKVMKLTRAAELPEQSGHETLTYHEPLAEAANQQPNRKAYAGNPATQPCRRGVPGRQVLPEPGRDPPAPHRWDTVVHPQVHEHVAAIRRSNPGSRRRATESAKELWQYRTLSACSGIAVGVPPERLSKKPGMRSPAQAADSQAQDRRDQDLPQRGRAPAARLCRPRRDRRKTGLRHQGLHQVGMPGSVNRQGRKLQINGCSVMPGPNRRTYRPLHRFHRRSLHAVPSSAYR
jgi:hypothetical protein